MKFGTKVPSTVPNFTLLGGYLRISGPKNRIICPKISKLDNCFAPQGRIAHPILVKFMCCMRLICLRNVLIFGAIWYINDKFVIKKLRWLFSPKFLEPPSSETTVWTQNVEVGSKMVWTCSVLMPSLVEICHRQERKKWVFFVCLFLLFVFLFVTLTICVSLDYRCAQCEGYIHCVPKKPSTFLSTHADRHVVDISVTVCFLCVCVSAGFFVRDISGVG